MELDASRQKVRPVLQSATLLLKNVPAGVAADIVEDLLKGLKEVKSVQLEGFKVIFFYFL